FFFFYSYFSLLHLYSFPTRRSSDLAIIVVIYTYLGGLRSVVITDSIQFLFMFAGLFIGGFYIFSQLGGWSGVVDSVPDNLTEWVDRKSTRLNSSHVSISYAVFCLKK